MTACLPHPDDTIAALASAAGAAARGIVRLSGPQALAIVEGLLDKPLAATPRGPPTCVSRTLQIAGFSPPMPVAVCAWPGRRSYTREPLVELHLPGSPPILDAVLTQVYERGARPAQPGEFTLRAFLAGRIDLVQAEAVLGVIEAADGRDLQAALGQLAGGVSTQILRLRGDLLDLLADLEAGLDFADEAIEFVSHAAIVGRAGLVRDEVQKLLRCAAGRLRGAPRPAVVLAGPPNAGKSTLFNALVGADAALVSETSGTTRDYLSAEIEIDRLPITLVDTAGAEPGATGVRAAAEQKRYEIIGRAELVVWCRPADSEAPRTPPCGPDRCLPIVTKCDLSRAPADALAVSARTGTGLPELRAAIAGRLAAEGAGDAPFVSATAVRCRIGLANVIAALDRALAIARREADQELLAIEIREALDELGKIVGVVYTDDLLDRIFSKFCIGK